MPIDFIANFFHFPQKNTIQKNDVQNVSFKRNESNDTFVKTINVGEKTSSAYDGISVTEKNFGKLTKDEATAKLYTITNKNGASVSFSDFGATIVSIKIPDKNGKLIDVTQGYDNVTPYETAPVGHAGGTIGPCANKINGGKFVINNEEYELEKNKDNGQTHCHGGTNGFDVKLWNTQILPDGIEFSYKKADMESGYPGNVDIKVTYKFDNDNNLRIMYSASSDKDTLLNLTNHTYFNLDGEENAQENSVLEHIVKLPNSSKITENNEMAIPTGRYIDVKGTPFDFRNPHKIKESINNSNEQLKIGSGYDQNYCVDNYDGKSLIEVAEVKSEKTGIKLNVYTNLPGFQFYTANHLGKTAQPGGKSGLRYEKRSAICVEPQIFPNAINTDNFEEKGILKKGETYNREIVYSFASK